MRSPRSPVSRADRARIRFYLDHRATYATIEKDLNVSTSSIRRVKKNKYHDNVAEDHLYLFKNEGGDRAIAATDEKEEKEVIEISSDSESDSEDEVCDEVGGDRKSRRLRHIAAPDISILSNPEELLPQPHARFGRSTTSANDMPPYKLEGHLPAQPIRPNSGKRVRFNEESEETGRKRQKQSDRSRSHNVFDQHHDRFDGLKTSSTSFASSSKICGGRTFNLPIDAVSSAKPVAKSAFVKSMARLSIDPPGVRVSAIVPKPASAVASKPATVLGPIPVPVAQPIAPQASQASPEGNPKHRNVRPEAEIKPAEGSLDHLLATLGLAHCGHVLHKAGFRSLADLEMLKKNLAKERTRQEVRSIFMAVEGGGLVLRDWLKLSEYLVPDYGQ